MSGVFNTTINNLRGQNCRLTEIKYFCMDMKSKNTDITSGLENIGAAIEDCMKISGIDTLKTNLKQANKNIPICIDEITAACDRKTVSIDRDISHYEYLQRQDNITWY